MKAYKISTILVLVVLFTTGCCQLPLVAWEWPQQEPGRIADATLTANHASARIVWSASVATERNEPEGADLQFIDAGPLTVDGQGKFIAIEQRGNVVLFSAEDGSVAAKIEKELPSSLSGAYLTQRGPLLTIDGGQNLTGTWREFLFFNFKESAEPSERILAENINSSYYAGGLLSYVNMPREGVKIIYKKIGEEHPQWQYIPTTRFLKREGFYHLDTITAVDGKLVFVFQVVDIDFWDTPGTADTVVTAIDPIKGKLLWETELGDTEEVLPLSPLFPLKNKNGRHLHTKVQTFGGKILINHIRSQKEGISYPMESESFALDLNGQVVWRRQGLSFGANDVEGKPIIAAFSPEGTLDLLDPDTGNARVSTDIDGRLMGAALNAKDGILVFVKAIEIEDRLQTYTEAVSLTDGSSLWQIVNENPPANPVMGSGYVALGDPFASGLLTRKAEVYPSDARLSDTVDVYAVDSGELLFRLSFEPANSTKVVRALAAENRLYLRTDDGRLLAVEFNIERRDAVSPPVLDLNRDELDVTDE